MRKPEGNDELTDKLAIGPVESVRQGVDYDLRDIKLSWMKIREASRWEYTHVGEVI